MLIRFRSVPFLSFSFLLLLVHGFGRLFWLLLVSGLHPLVGRGPREARVRGARNHGHQIEARAPASVPTSVVDSAEPQPR